ncbi:MAG: NnrS family protein [Steroidobacteraceae bacterium]
MPRPTFALFAYGFRPFFWLTGVFALIAIIAWLGIVSTGLLPLPGQPALLWHGHEMLYGFVGAAIAGFLLTAVPSWTGARGFAGAPLVLLALVWLAGRLAFATAAILPLTVVAVCELAFIPALACLVAPPLLRARNRNTPLLFVLLAVWLSDVVFMVALVRGDGLLARSALLVAIDIVLLLITVIGGRIVPAFTSSALRGRGMAADLRTNRWTDGVAIGAMLAIVIVDIFAPWQRAAGIVAALAAIAHLWRLAGWRSLRTLGEPLVWSLHLAYVWMPVGLALKAIFMLTGSVWTTHWLHALTVGAAASMVVAVMTRAALGHTGRPLLAARSIAVAYLLLSLAAVVRVFLPPFAVIDYRWTVFIAGALWLAAFALFLIKYTPILMHPRIDGGPG